MAAVAGSTQPRARKNATARFSRGSEAPDDSQGIPDPFEANVGVDTRVRRAGQRQNEKTSRRQ